MSNNTVRDAAPTLAYRLFRIAWTGWAGTSVVSLLGTGWAVLLVAAA